MKRVRYTKYIGDLGSEMDLEDLLKALSDYLLDSGFRDSYTGFGELDHNLDDLREALRRVLESGDLFNEEMREKLDQMMAKIGRVLEVDVSERPGRITALEALAATILNTTVEQLKIEIEGM